MPYILGNSFVLKINIETAIRLTPKTMYNKDAFAHNFVNSNFLQTSFSQSTNFIK